MRKFTAECTDKKTGYSMVLSGCSYNMACDFLERELHKKGICILDCEVASNGLVRIRTIRANHLRRTFYYDEERGYLLGE